jgi:hypothetical protein
LLLHESSGRIKKVCQASDLIQATIRWEAPHEKNNKDRHSIYGVSSIDCRLWNKRRALPQKAREMLFNVSLDVSSQEAVPVFGAEDF